MNTTYECDKCFRDIPVGNNCWECKNKDNESPVKNSNTTDWKEGLNKILWNNLDLKEIPERPMLAKTQVELEDFIEQEIKQAYQDGYRDAMDETNRVMK